MSYVYMKEVEAFFVLEKTGLLNYPVYLCSENLFRGNFYHFHLVSDVYANRFNLFTGNHVYVEQGNERFFDIISGKDEFGYLLSSGRELLVKHKLYKILSSTDNRLRVRNLTSKFKGRLAAYYSQEIFLKDFYVRINSDRQLVTRNPDSLSGVDLFPIDKTKYIFKGDICEVIE